MQIHNIFKISISISTHTCNCVASGWGGKYVELSTELLVIGEFRDVFCWCIEGIKVLGVPMIAFRNIVVCDGFSTSLGIVVSVTPIIYCDVKIGGGKLYIMESSSFFSPLRSNYDRIVSLKLLVGSM